MSDRLVRKFKFFWDDADHALERWLEQMARQGLHLQSVGLLRCIFTFRRGAPAEMTYRLDFQLSRAAPDYVQLFVDAGWEHVDQSLGWQFWRAPSSAGRTPEIFTDTESRIRKYQRLLWLFALAWLPLPVMLAIKGWAILDTPKDILLLLAIMGGMVYAMVRLVRRIRRLRNPLP
jgi:hypothetical protein